MKLHFFEKKHNKIICLVALSAFLCFPLWSQKNEGLTLIEQKTDQLHFKNSRLIPLFSCEIDAIEKELAKHKLSANSSDWERAYQSLSAKKHYADSLLTELDNILFYDAEKALSDQDSMKSLDYLDISLRYNKFNVSALKLKANLLLEKYDLDTATAFLKPNAKYLQHKKTIHDLSLSLYRLHIEEIRNLCENEHYVEALDIYEQMSDFRTALNLQPYDSIQEFNLLSQIHKGQYADLQAVADKAYKVGRTKIAEYYALKTKAYYEDHKAYILYNNVNQNETGEKTEKLLADIAEEYLDIAQTSDSEEAKYYEIKAEQIKQGEESELIVTANRVPEITKTKDTSAVRTALETPEKPLAEAKITKKYNYRKQKEFEDIVHEGRLLLLKNDLEEALSEFQKAGLINRDYIIKADEDIESLIQSTAKIWMIQYLNKAQYNVWVNNEDRGDSLFVIANSIAEKFKLKGDVIADNELAAYNQAKADKICRERQTDINFLLREAQSAAKSHRYTEAENKLWQALDISKDHDCNFRLGEVNQLLRRIEKPTVYQNMIKQAQAEYKQGNFKQYLVNYNSAKDYYFSNNLNNFAFKHIPLEEDLYAKRDSDGIVEAVRFFTDRNAFEQAQALIAVLEKMNYSKRMIRKLQRHVKM